MPSSVVPTPRLIGLVMAGGLAGAAVRVAIAAVVPSDGFPWSTVAVNLAGAALIGWLLPRVRGRRHSMAFLVLGIGGTATTFSALTIDAMRLLEADRVAAVLGYLGLSVIGGFFLASAAIRVSRSA